VDESFSTLPQVALRLFSFLRAFENGVFDARIKDPIVTDVQWMKASQPYRR
jgi:hypothetical protein